MPLSQRTVQGRISSPSLPGEWVDDDDDSVGSPDMAPPQPGNDKHLHLSPKVVPQAYNRSEKLHLEFWDPCRLAAHVLATLLPEGKRAAAVEFILEKQITGSFLARYTYEFDNILSGEHCELARDIARTIPRTFWTPWRAPLSERSRYRLQEIVADLRASTNIVPSVTDSKLSLEKRTFSSNDRDKTHLAASIKQEKTPNATAAAASLPEPDEVVSARDGNDGGPTEVPGRRGGGTFDLHSMWAQPAFWDWGSTLFGSYADTCKGGEREPGQLSQRDGTAEWCCNM
ncbi:hypothetical protein BJV78DRAFT_1288142 [Lactifluus subvellereus]|nr:hypothetical protein BJV78DRAFT_1288142 [Lactifluus subvellereus]